uniref:Band 4.1-like protein 3-like isoform X3 n=1 Tax=Saccoglossus kowalevskii TaxID=10224 RepID=A0ABM0LTQ7_SACKO|nr:PREDICTED: band 4.1-like protein 3-like isoform X3 [Saccoglossus kowalevskii]
MTTEEGQAETAAVEENRPPPPQQRSPVKKSPEPKRAPSRHPKMQSAKILLMDSTEVMCEVEKKSKGQALLDKVCDNMNLMEKDYFGLTYRDAADQKYWLDPVKDIKKQIRSGTWVFNFNVKFYPPDPSQLQEDITRYHLVLQLRDDILKGKLPCSFVTHALLGSYIVQAELGDYDPEEHGTDPTYLSDFRFAPNQARELEEKIMELHKTHKGQTPAEAELHYLENAKKLAMYGVDLHHARDSEGVDIMLGVCANGLLIYRDRLRINRFAWPKILKISYKRNNFYIKIRPGEVFEQFESTIGFKLANHRAAKRLWKVCVEHHTFFRLVQPEPPPKGKLFHLGSKFRYSGRTQFQTRQTNALIDRPSPAFERISSKRFHSLDGGYGPPRDANRPDETKPNKDDVQPVADEKVPFADNERGGPGPGGEPDETRQDATSDEGEYDGETGYTHKPGDENQEGSPHRWGTSYEMKTTTTTVSHVRDGYPVGTDDQDKEPEPEDEPKQTTESPVRGRVPVGGMPHQFDPEDNTVVTRTYTTEVPPPEGQPREYGTVITKETVIQTSVQRVPGSYPDYGGPAVAPYAPQSSDEEIDDDNVADTKEPEETAPSYLDEYLAEQADEDDEEMLATPSFEAAPVVKTAALKYQPGDDDDTTATTDVPIVHTETKTITYESNETNEDENTDIDPSTLQSAQTITSETHTTTTTTHITKTVKGGVSETRVEKKIVIQGDADIDHDQALADAIKEATALNPDMTVTKVVVHKEGDEVVEHVQENGNGSI